MNKKAGTLMNKANETKNKTMSPTLMTWFRSYLAI